jgi:L,D-transpeptidase catalytic domain
MNKNILGAIIIILLGSNIYLFTKYYNKQDKPKQKYGTANTTMAVENTTTTVTTASYAVPTYEINAEMKKVRANMLMLKTYALLNKCNIDYGFVIDMRIPSYKNRFFVYNLRRDSIVAAGLVAHGTGSETFRGDLVFSNVPDSRCSSLGKYKIGISYKGMWGFSYKLQGLDSTNNKAFERAIVLHGHTCIPTTEPTDGFPICFSYGCPMVSPAFLQTLKGYISKQGKSPILLSIIY